MNLSNLREEHMLQIVLVTLGLLIAIIIGAFIYMNKMADKFKKARSEKRKELVKRMNEGDVNARDDDGYTLLMIAARAKFPKLAIELIKDGADVNLKGPSGETALHHAAHFSSEKIVNALLSNKAEVDLKDEKGYTPLWFAAQRNNEKIIQKLIDYGATIDYVDPNFEFTPLMVAAQNGNYKVVNTLLDNGADYLIESPLGTAADIGENRLTQNLKRLDIDREALKESIEHLRTITDEKKAMA
jgi:ankyrin repeat protein